MQLPAPRNSCCTSRMIHPFTLPALSNFKLCIGTDVPRSPIHLVRSCVLRVRPSHRPITISLPCIVCVLKKPIIKLAACRKMYVNVVPCYLRNSMDNAFKKMNRGCMTLLLVVKPRPRLRASTPPHAEVDSVSNVYFGRDCHRSEIEPPTSSRHPHLVLIPAISRHNVGISGYPVFVPAGNGKNRDFWKAEAISAPFPETLVPMWWNVRFFLCATSGLLTGKGSMLCILLGYGVKLHN